MPLSKNEAFQESKAVRFRDLLHNILPIVNNNVYFKIVMSGFLMLL